MGRGAVRNLPVWGQDLRARGRGPPARQGLGRDASSPAAGELPALLSRGQWMHTHTPAHLRCAPTATQPGVLRTRGTQRPPSPERTGHEAATYPWVLRPRKGHSGHPPSGALNTEGYSSRDRFWVLPAC